MYVALKTKTPQEVKNVIKYFTPITVTIDDKATYVLTREIRIFRFFNDASKRVTSY
jgi:hypothetical protein